MHPTPSFPPLTRDRSRYRAAIKGRGTVLPAPSLAFFLEACPVSAPPVARAGTREPGGSKANPEFHREVSSRNGKAPSLVRFRSSTSTVETVMQLASIFHYSAPTLCADSPLSDDQIRRVAPSIFADGKHESRSERYTYIPTIEVLRGLRNEGF